MPTVATCYINLTYSYAKEKGDMLTHVAISSVHTCMCCGLQGWI